MAHTDLAVSSCTRAMGGRSWGAQVAGRLAPDSPVYFLQGVVYRDGRRFDARAQPGEDSSPSPPTRRRRRWSRMDRGSWIRGGGAMSGRGSFFTGLVAGVLGIATACGGSDVPAEKAGTAAEACAARLHSGPGDPGWPAHRLAREAVHDWQQSGEDFALIDAGTPFLPASTYPAPSTCTMWRSGLADSCRRGISGSSSALRRRVPSRSTPMRRWISSVTKIYAAPDFRAGRTPVSPPSSGRFRRRFRLTALPGR